MALSRQINKSAKEAITVGKASANGGRDTRRRNGEVISVTALIALNAKGNINCCSAAIGAGSELIGKNVAVRYDGIIVS